MVARKSTTNATARVNTSGRTTAKKSAGLSGTSIVRNTGTTSTSNVTPSYSIVNMPRRRSCEKEKIGLQRISAVSPVVATKVDDEEYKISLNFEALKEVIQGYDELDLCGVNVKLCTVSGDTVFSGEVTFDKMNANEAEIGTLNVTDKANIQELEVIWTSTFDGETLFKEKVTFEKEIETNGINNTGVITTDTLNATDISTTNITADDVSCNTLEVSELASIADENVTHSHITNADIDSASITDETVGTSNITTATIGTETVTDSTITNATIDSEVVNTSTINTATITDATIATATIGEETVTKSTITDATITKATISTEDVTVSNVTTANIDTANIDNAVINTETVTDSTIANATIDNATITKEKVTDSEVDNLVVNTTADVKGDLIVSGNTDVQTLEVNGAANFREDVKIFDDFYVSGNASINGDTKINWDFEVNGDETHSGNVVYNGDVIFRGTLTADDLDVDMQGYQKIEEKGVASGYASLDNTGKVPFSQLPNISWGVNYKGEWDAGTGTYPVNPSNWDMYYCSNGGTVGSITYSVGDRIIYDGDDFVWMRLPDNYGVQSVNGRTGIVVDVQDTTDRKNAIDLVNPATNKYLSEKAVADLINPLIERVEELEEETAKTTIKSLDSTSGLPATMNEGQSYTVPFENLRATDHIVILDTVTNGNIVITPGNGQISIVSSANETSPVVNVLVIKGE